ncbi:hypothetical protein HU200_055137 [Digitaria exilis]|uniref:Uncharacterized protein n=1 Tax=Digitaria exilis TaxID=1010633 RepID=A0A835AJK1_9POAL|nr:hypothetical protein HU200_055137 [Digitaria exilis]
MDFPKRERPLHQGSPRRSPKALRPGAVAEADENASPKPPVPAWAASPPRKKVLGERNDGGGGAGMEAAATPPPQQQPKLAPSPPTLTGRGAGAYDPKTNYTTPRPEFLRYDPERRREILLRVARAAEVEEDDCSSSGSASVASDDDGGSVASNVAAASPVSSPRSSDSEAGIDDSDDEEEEEEEENETPPRRGRWARRLFLLLVAMACSFFYMHCMNPATFPLHPEDGLDFSGPIGGMYAGDDLEVEELRLLGPVFMMGPEDVLGDTANQFVHGGSGNESSETVSGHETGVGVESFERNDESCEVSYLGANISLDSIGSSSTDTADMEEGDSGPVHQEEGEDHSNPLVLQLDSMERAIESESDNVIDIKSLESEELNLDTELWQYENTAEAAKAVCSIVKFLWSAMEPHLLQILACLSAAGFVAAMFSYFQRSREMVVPAPQHMTSRSIAEVPVLVPHQIVQCPVPPPPQAVQLPVYSEQPAQPTVSEGLPGSLEVPIEFPLPNPDPFVRLKDHVQEPLPKTETFVRLKVPMDHGKLQQGDANNRNVDRSKPPVVEILGEFTFANSSRGRPIKNMNQYAEDAAVSELLEKDVDKMHMNSSIVQTPSVRGGRKEVM